MHEIVVDNVEDFKANNKDLFNPRYPFLTWIFQLLKKDGHTENCFTIGLRKWKKIHFKREFQYLPLLSPKIRILMLTFVSLCEIIGITFRIFWGKLLKVTILQLFAKPYTVQMFDFSVYNVHLLCYSNRKMFFSRELYYNDCKLWCWGCFLFILLCPIIVHTNVGRNNHYSGNECLLYLDAERMETKKTFKQKLCSANYILEKACPFHHTDYEIWWLVHLQLYCRYVRHKHSDQCLSGDFLRNKFCWKCC